MLVLIVPVSGHCLLDDMMLVPIVLVSGHCLLENIGSGFTCVWSLLT